MAHDIPPSFVFTDLDAANAEVSRLYRAVACSGAALADVLDLLPEHLWPKAETIAHAFMKTLDAITAEREAGK